MYCFKVSLERTGPVSTNNMENPEKHRLCPLHRSKNVEKRDCTLLLKDQYEIFESKDGSMAPTCNESTQPSHTINDHSMGVWRALG